MSNTFNFLISGILAFDEKNNEASMSNIVMLHLTSNGDYSTSDDNLNQQPLNHPVKSSMTGRLDVIIGNTCCLVTAVLFFLILTLCTPFMITVNNQVMKIKRYLCVVIL